MITLTSYQWTDDFFGQWLKVGRECTDLVLSTDGTWINSGRLELGGSPHSHDAADSGQQLRSAWLELEGGSTHSLLETSCEQWAM
ncbi:hypothetical protein CY34DRAFT_813068, partial [Suillus luteus UH-Slu-Lm8-n1]